MLHNLILPKQPPWLDGNTGLHDSEAKDRASWVADGTSS
jgi:hypothetical protein